MGFKNKKEVLLKITGWNFKIIVSITIFLLFGYSQALSSKYCSTPPFISTSLKPNVLLVMDYSGSMQFPAYYDCEFDGYYYTWGPADCGDTGEVDLSYNGSNTYYGYFQADKCYSYNSSEKYWEESSCNCSSNGNRGTINCLKGNFLNFLTMSRIDVALKALIGGKAECNSSYCVLHPQGSKRYVDDEDLHCRYFIRPQNYNSSLPPFPQKDILISIMDHEGECELGTFSDRYANVKVSLKSREGIIQRSFSNLRLTFMVFGRDNYREGEIRYIFSQNDLSALVEALKNEIPYGGTPTGEALREAWDFLAQRNNYNYESNSPYINRSSQYDPFYYESKAAPCIKNFVVLISDGEWNGDIDPDGPARELHVEDLRNDFNGTQTATIYTLYTFSEDEDGLNSMRTVAAWGSFNDKVNCNDGAPFNFPDYATTNSKNVTFPRPSCDPENSYNSTCCKEWDKNGDGVPDTFFSAVSGEELERALNKIFTDILNKASSGTSISVLSEKISAGRGLVQAVFYPSRNLGDKNLDWLGFLNTFWFYVTPQIASIRENNYYVFPDEKALEVCHLTGTSGGDRILKFKLENSTGDLFIEAYDSYCNGTPKKSPNRTYNDIDSFDNDKSPIKVWEAGILLAQTDNRIIYTSGNIDNLLNPSENMTELKYLSNSQIFGSDNGSDNIIDDEREIITYINGTALNATVSNLIDYLYYGNSTGNFRNRNFEYGNQNCYWKLGDIVYSTPHIVDYGNFSVVYVGANDGMLHAFLYGKERYDNLSEYQKVKLCENNNIESCVTEKLGKELWAFIPKNAIPYLRFLADPEYCHLYYVDLQPFIYHEDFNQNEEIDPGEKVILIGGMRLGGGVGENGTDYIHPPLDTCPAPETSSCVGLSSYFALDVTDPVHPRFLWEFTTPDLGFTYSGPALITYNRKRYVLFLTGPVNHEANSTEPLDLKAFVLPLTNEFKIENGTYIEISIKNELEQSYKGFGGRLFTTGVDINNDGNTDFVPFGFTYYKNGWKGGIGIVKINDESPANWQISILKENIGPITASVRYMKCCNSHWLYYGTGRWFYKKDPSGSSREILAGLQLSEGLDNFTAEWQIELNDNETDPETGIPYAKERSITDPQITPQNIVMFTTFEPTDDVCGFGGRSRLWALACDTGQAISSNTTTCNYQSGGFILLQLSRGNIEQIKISPESFTMENNRATNWFIGTPPEASPLFINPSNVEGRIIYWIEK